MSSSRRPPRFLRPAVDAVMALALLLQMVPGVLGNPAHELVGVAFVLLFALHHVLNRGWWGRLRGRSDVRSRCALASDVALTSCVLGTALTGIVMSRSLAPALAVPALSHVARPAHGALAYASLMACAFHVGLHLRVVRGYTGRRGAVRMGGVRAIVALAVGAWAFARLDVAGTLLGRPSFPDGVTPLATQLVLHLALCSPFIAAGSLVDARDRKGERHG